jgi:hypothetical protein
MNHAKSAGIIFKSHAHMLLDICTAFCGETASNEESQSVGGRVVPKQASGIATTTRFHACFACRVQLLKEMQITDM